ncbi:unnamed protein product [Amoebophrya sp. A120]|nr:unnamed protein product [Amoebophrya sp. A120]|eukprot:GSA120T00010568001.1
MLHFFTVLLVAPAVLHSAITPARAVLPPGSRPRMRRARTYSASNTASSAEEDTSQRVIIVPPPAMSRPLSQRSPSLSRTKWRHRMQPEPTVVPESSVPSPSEDELGDIMPGPKDIDRLYHDHAHLPGVQQPDHLHCGIVVPPDSTNIVHEIEKNLMLQGGRQVDPLVVKIPDLRQLSARDVQVRSFPIWPSCPAEAAKMMTPAGSQGDSSFALSRTASEDSNSSSSTSPFSITEEDINVDENQDAHAHERVAFRTMSPGRAAFASRTPEGVMDAGLSAEHEFLAREGIASVVKKRRDDEQAQDESHDFSFFRATDEHGERGPLLHSGAAPVSTTSLHGQKAYDEKSKEPGDHDGTSTAPRSSALSSRPATKVSSLQEFLSKQMEIEQLSLIQETDFLKQFYFADAEHDNGYETEDERRNSSSNTSPSKSKALERDLRSLVTEKLSLTLFRWKLAQKRVQQLKEERKDLYVLKSGQNLWPDLKLAARVQDMLVFAEKSLSGIRREIRDLTNLWQELLPDEPFGKVLLGNHLGGPLLAADGDASGP